jgi:hypothetical protein
MGGNNIMINLILEHNDIIGFISAVAGILALVIAIAGSWRTNKRVAAASLLAFLFAGFAAILLYTQDEVRGEFEWQWAGENWLNKVTIENIGDNKGIANIRAYKIFKKVIDGKIAIPGDDNPTIFRSSKDGSISGNKNGFKIDLPVTGSEDYTFDAIKGKLYPVKAYAGSVNYIWNDGKSKEGDMILVKYKSTIRP